MRKIICLRMPGQGLNNAVLEECSRHSFLVEPFNVQEVLVDLSTFKKIGIIIAGIAGLVRLQGEERATMGVAASPLVSIIAARRERFKSQYHQDFKRYGVRVIRVIPGSERGFLSSLPLSAFFPLTLKEKKLLRRAGYNLVGELADLNPNMLKQIIKRDSALLLQNCRGIDYTPVKGIYPPGRLVHTILFPGGCSDYIKIQAGLKKISRAIAGELEQKRAGFRKIRTEVITIDGDIKAGERTLFKVCSGVMQLENLIQIMVEKEDLKEPVGEIRVIVMELEKLKFQAANLFTYRQDIKDQERLLVLQQLQEKYPQSLQLGVKPDRREQVLSMWDPWRIAIE
ncbi:MAG: hypothetical protein ACOXZ5_02810 [Syntrophomonadaceae bacterium]